LGKDKISMRDRKAVRVANVALAPTTLEWQLEMRNKRKHAAAKGVDAELAGAVEQLRGVLRADWYTSASLGELELVTVVDTVSIRVKRRLHGMRWLCTAWTKGPAADGLQIAKFRADGPAGALTGALKQMCELHVRLGALL
jgi:hypothetical protein